MKSLLIKDTTTEERRDIVRNALDFGGADCEGIDMDDLYDDYILGLKELADINREFSEKHAGCVKADNMERPPLAAAWDDETATDCARRVPPPPSTAIATFQSAADTHCKVFYRPTAYFLLQTEVPKR